MQVEYNSIAAAAAAWCDSVGVLGGSGHWSFVPEWGQVI